MPRQSKITDSVTVTNLQTDLPVVTGSTTSRVVVANELLRVVQFTFDAGEGLTEHTSPRAVVCQLGEGRMTFTVDGDTRELGPGDIVYLAPGAPHSLSAVEPCRLTLVMVDTAP